MRNKLLIALIIFIVVLVIALLPKLASTSLGKPIFVKVFEAEIQGKVQIGSLHLSWLGPQRFQQLTFANPNIEGSIEELQQNVPLWSISSVRAFLLKNGSFSFPSYGDGTIDQVNGQIQGADFQLNGVTHQEGSSGHIAVNGKIYSKEHFEVQGDVTSFPVAALDQIFNAKNLLFQILGPHLNLKGSASMNHTIGAVDLDIAATNLTTAIHANFVENGMTLREPVSAVLQLTPALSEMLMSDINPLFLTGVEGHNPIHLQVDSHGFFYPIPYAPEKLQGNGSLDMGKITCRNGKSLASIISLLKLNPLSKTREMNVWFTPLVFRVYKGIVHTDRMDALVADSIHICTWGYIDLGQDKVHINLGIPADTLQKTFKIKNLSDNYVLKVPIRGTTKEPDLEKGPAAAKIAAMIAASQIPKKGGVFGGLVNAYTQSKEDKNIPPAKHPFPWER